MAFWLFEELVRYGIDADEFEELLILTQEAHRIYPGKRDRVEQIRRWISELYIDALYEQKEYSALADFAKEYLSSLDQNRSYRAKVTDHLQSLEVDEENKELFDRLAPGPQEDTEQKEEEGGVELIRYGDYYLVDVTIDGVVYRMLLDTGAGGIVIDSNRYGQNFGAPLGNITLQTIGGEVEAQYFNANLFQIGDKRLHDIAIILTPIVQEHYDGILGMSVLKHFGFRIDHKKALLYLN